MKKIMRSKRIKNDDLKNKDAHSALRHFLEPWLFQCSDPLLKNDDDLKNWDELKHENDLKNTVFANQTEPSNSGGNPEDLIQCEVLP